MFIACVLFSKSALVAFSSSAVSTRVMRFVIRDMYSAHRSSISLSECMAFCLLLHFLCRIKLLPVTHVLVDTWMLTVKLVYKVSDVPDDLKWATNTRDTIYTHFQDLHN